MKDIWFLKKYVEKKVKSMFKMKEQEAAYGD